MPTSEDLRQAFQRARRALYAKATFTIIHDVAGVYTLSDVPEAKRAALIAAFNKAVANAPTRPRAAAPAMHTLNDHDDEADGVDDVDDDGVDEVDDDAEEAAATTTATKRPTLAEVHAGLQELQQKAWAKFNRKPRNN